MQYTTSAGYRQVQAKLRSSFVIINIYNLLYIATHLISISLCGLYNIALTKGTCSKCTHQLFSVH